MATLYYLFTSYQIMDDSLKPFTLNDPKIISNDTIPSTENSFMILGELTLEFFKGIMSSVGEKAGSSLINAIFPRDDMNFFDDATYETIKNIVKNEIEQDTIQTINGKINNVLYKGQRNTITNHLKVAEEHGFTRIPVIIADGEAGEDYELVEINKILKETH